MLSLKNAQTGGCHCSWKERIFVRVKELVQSLDVPLRRGRHIGFGRLGSSGPNVDRPTVDDRHRGRPRQ